MSAAEVIAPRRIPTWPASSRGSQCRAKILDTPSSAPAAMTSSAPPGMTSSAGWNISRTPTGSSGSVARASPAPSKMVVWGVVPACMGHTGDCGRVRRSGRLLHRQSVHVGAQCDSWTLRSDIARETGATGKDLRRQSSGSKAGGDEFGGRVFAASQLRVGMDVSTPRDEVVGVRVNPRVDCRVHRRSTPSNRRARCSGSDATRTAVRANAIAPSTTARSAEVVIHAAANSG